MPDEHREEYTMNEIMTRTTNELECTWTADLFSEYLRYIGDVKESTLRTYQRSLRIFAQYLLDNNITAPTRDTIIQFKNHLTETGHKATTVQNYLCGIRLFFEWTELQGCYPNIARRVKGDKVSRDHKRNCLTEDQIRTVLSSIDRSTISGKRDYSLIALAVTAGLRTIELSLATVGDLDAVGGHTVLWIRGKGHADADDYVKVEPAVEWPLRDYLTARGHADADEPLFLSTSHRTAGSMEAMTTRSISRIIKDRFKAVGLDSDRLTAHSLRHTAVTLSILNGETMQATQQFARHANISTTQLYYHEVEKINNTCGATVAASIFR